MTQVALSTAISGTVTTPSISVAGSPTTGLYTTGANALAIAANGAVAATISANGDIAFGVAGNQTSGHQIWGSSLTLGSLTAGQGCSLNVSHPTSIAASFVAGTTNSTDAVRIKKVSGTTSTANVFVLFQVSNGGANSGYITANGAEAATFTSTSDARLKENIVNLPPQLANILSLRPVEFDYIAGGHQTGFIAQEMQAVYPDCVAEKDDGFLTLAGWSKTEARLVKAIQELSAKNDALAARLLVLESK
jgi:hypothetical protein